MISNEDMQELIARVRVCNNRLVLDPTHPANVAGCCVAAGCEGDDVGVSGPTKLGSSPIEPILAWMIEIYGPKFGGHFLGRGGACFIDSVCLFAWVSRQAATDYRDQMIHRNPSLRNCLYVNHVSKGCLHPGVELKC